MSLASISSATTLVQVPIISQTWMTTILYIALITYAGSLFYHKSNTRSLQAIWKFQKGRENDIIHNNFARVDHFVPFLTTHCSMYIFTDFLKIRIIIHYTFMFLLYHKYFTMTLNALKA